ncbi:MAG: hypothetical protein QW815_06350 [Nitrososphaerota archaeon]
MSGERLKVLIEMGDLKAEAEGTAEEVLRFVSSFIGQHLPAYSLARRLASGPDLAKLVDALQDFLGYSEGEGLYIKPTARSLSNPQRILLYLAKKRIESLMGLSERGSADVPALLAELAREGLVQRVERGEYQITMAGLEELLNRLKTPGQEG